MRRFFDRLNNSFASPTSNGSSPQQVGNSPRNGSSFVEEEVNGDQYDTPFDFWNPEFASDPAEWERAFKAEWEELKKSLNRPVKTLKDVSQVCKHLEAMCKLLVMEVNSLPVASIGPLLELVFAHDVYDLVVKWSKKIPVFLIPTCQVMLLGIYERLVSRNYSQTHCLLVHKPILLPLLELLQWCQENFKDRSFQKSSINKHFVLLLHQICMKISDDARLLDFFFNPRCTDENDEYKDQKPFLVFNLLVGYIFGFDEISYQARDAILLILTASRKLDFVAKHVAYESDFCPVLSSGLSACFSELPGYVCEALRVREDEFHKIYINRSMDSIPEICNFHSALLFCNAVVQISHVDISRQIVKYFYDGFLLQVVDPLLEMDPDKFLSRIAYFHLCIEIITEPSMIQAILKMLTAAETNIPDMNLLEVILDKMNSSDRLCRAVLSLLRTLLELRCEDFLWASLFRYILPFVKLRPQRLRFDTHVCLDAANAFLACIPNCILEVPELVSSETFHVYNLEAYELLRATSKNTRQWAFHYDGLTPNNLLNLNIPEESLSARQPFIRLSSARSTRSSMASNAWNRYFQSRSAHTTNDSMFAPDSGRLPLNQLGEEDILLNLSDEEQQVLILDESSNESGHDELITNYDLMTQSNTDYFQFAYDGISESDESSRHNSIKDEEDVEVDKKMEFTGTPLTPAKQKFLSEIKLQDWLNANESIESLTGTLSQIKYDPKTMEATTVDESISLINARYQHLVELNTELESLESERKTEENPLKLDLSINGTKTKINGLLMTCTMEKGSGYLFEALITALEMMIEHNFTTNIQLASVLEILASYPQPIIASVLLYSDALNGNALPRLTRVLEKLKTQIDAFASSVDNFDELIRRGARNRLGGRMEQQPKRSFTPRNTTFRHLQMSAARENGISDRSVESARIKNFAYAGIVLSQIAQQMAAFAVQQCPTYSISN